jgi:hypothetical protein
MDVKGATNATFAGASGVEGVLLQSNGQGRVALAGLSKLADGAVLGYVEFSTTSKENVEVSLDNVTANDMAMPSSSTTLKLAAAGVSNGTARMAVEQNFPNPFNLSTAKSTAIKFTVAGSENVSLAVYDMLGNEIRTLTYGETFAAGTHTIQWDGRDNTGNLVSNGLYYYQLKSAGVTETVKMQVVR